MHVCAPLHLRDCLASRIVALCTQVVEIIEAALMAAPQDTHSSFKRQHATGQRPSRESRISRFASALTGTGSSNDPVDTRHSSVDRRGSIFNSTVGNRLSAFFSKPTGGVATGAVVV